MRGVGVRKRDVSDREMLEKPETSIIYKDTRKK